jgi:hypothetical protein
MPEHLQRAFHDFCYHEFYRLGECQDYAHEDNFVTHIAYKYKNDTPYHITKWMHLYFSKGKNGLKTKKIHPDLQLHLKEYYKDLCNTYESEIEDENR